MAIAVNGFDGKAFSQNSADGLSGRFIRTYHLLTFSGNYSTGGDTLDFTNGGVASAVPPLARTLVAAAVISQGPAAGLEGSGGFYHFINGAAFNSCKLQAFKNTAGSVAEYAAGAYGADVTGDVVVIEAIWAR